MLKLSKLSLEMDDIKVFENINFNFGRQTYLLAGQMYKRKSLLLNEIASSFIVYNPHITYSAENGVAYLPNYQFLIETLTVKQNLDFFTRFFNTPAIKLRVLINHFELDNIVNRRVNSLTPDLIQLVRISCVLLNSTATIFLFDNIFINLNKSQIDLVKDFLKRLEHDNTLIFAKLNKHEIEDFNPRIITIVDKRLVYEEEK